MSRKRTQLERSLDELAEATDQLRAVLGRYKTANRKLTRLMSQGASAVDAIDQAGGATLRPEVTEAIDRLERARHDVRLRLIAVALEDGATVSDVARSLNFSRQLAARIAKEAR